MAVKSGTVLVVMLGVGGLTLAAGQGCQSRTTDATLTALDYAEIQQLYSRYAFAFDTAEENGEACARLFTSDGAFTFPLGDPAGRQRCDPECKGHDALVTLCRGRGNKGRLTLSHVTTNVVIEAAPEGARGEAYLMLPVAGPGPQGMGVAGFYEDIIVKTPEGWRFKLRAYTQLPTSQQPVAATLTR
jgi:hypothetical protein